MQHKLAGKTRMAEGVRKETGRKALPSNPVGHTMYYILNEISCLKSRQLCAACKVSDRQMYT